MKSTIVVLENKTILNVQIIKKKEKKKKCLTIVQILVN